MKKQKLGILGLGNRSTLFYINELNKRYNKCHAEFSTFPFLLYNTDFSLLNPFLPNNFEKLVPQLTIYLEELHDLGVTQLLIPNITLHETLDRIDCRLSVIHAVDSTIEAMKKIGKTEAVVFGSKYTMQSMYLKNKFSEQGIRLISPAEDDMTLIDQMRKKVYDEEENKAVLEQYNALLKMYTFKTSVVLACTELSVINNNTNSRVLDMALNQINDAIVYERF